MTIKIPLWLHQLINLPVINQQFKVNMDKEIFQIKFLLFYVSGIKKFYTENTKNTHLQSISSIIQKFP